MDASLILVKLFILCAVCAGMTKCFPRVPRSASPVEITFYPGLTEDYKDAVVFEQWRRFLEEEEAELAREESVALKLLQQERASLIEPIEYATQKRLLHQFKGSKKHHQVTQDNTHGLINVIGTVEEERRNMESINNIEEPLELVLLGPTQIENTAYSFGRLPLHKKTENQQEPTSDPLSSLQLSSISSEAVYRLLGDAPAAPHNNSPVTVTFPPAHQTQGASINSTNHPSSLLPSSNHEDAKNKRIQEIIQNQQQISEKDLNFLLEDERVSTVNSAIVPHGGSKSPPLSEVTSISANQEPTKREHVYKWTKEEQIDWEENHEYDA